VFHVSISAADIMRAGSPLSMFDPVYVGIDEFRAAVYLRIIYKNLLAAGLPGGGKSSLLNNLVAHAALSAMSRLVLFDAKKVELGMWDDVADEFVGPDMDKAIVTMLRLQKVLNNRCDWLYTRRRREIRPSDGLNVINIVFDELFMFSATLGTKEQRDVFITLLRDLVGRGRFAGMPVLAATQRPSIDIIPKSLRDLFGYRAAFRCTSMGSSDIILGDGWSAAGFDATTIRDTQQGVAYLIAEESTPQLIKAAYLSDEDIIALADYAWARGKRLTTTSR
jgi:DNA segregation ATPase FtsK/SpoIIIE, S-DNA-T family